MLTLREWFTENDFKGDDRDFAELLDRVGLYFECQTADYSLFVGNGFVVQNDPTGTHLLDNLTEFSVTQYNDRCEIREGIGVEVEFLYGSIPEDSEIVLLQP